MKEFFIESIRNTVGIEIEISGRKINKKAVISDLVRSLIGFVMDTTISVFVLICGFAISDETDDLRKTLLSVGFALLVFAIFSLMFSFREMFFLKHFDEIMSGIDERG